MEDSVAANQHPCFSRLILCLCVLLGVIVAPALGGGEFFTVPLGDGLIEGISDNGVATGSFGTPEYFMWTVEGGSVLIGGTVPGNGIGGQAKISNDGTRISGTFLNPDSGLNEMAYYEIPTATWNPLGGIGAACSAELTSGWNISGDGLSLVGLGWLSCSDAHAAHWREGVGMVDLGSTVPDQSSRANAVNLDGSVIAGWQDGAGRQGAVWVNGVQELIVTGGGSPAGEAFDVSANGIWVTGLHIVGLVGTANPYRYNSAFNVYQSLPNLPVGAESRAAGTGITDDGTTIVGGTWGVGPATFGNALIWREGIGTVAFDDYLDELGIAYPVGFHFAFASAISSDGSWIAGWGNIGGPANTQSWVVHISGPACPADLTGDGMVDSADLALLLGAWGPNPGHPADLTGDDQVDAADLALLLGDWGMCA